MSRSVTIFYTLCILLFTSAAYAGEPLVFAVHPYLPATELVEKFNPLIEYLAHEVEHRIEIDVARDYGDHITKIGDNKVDIAYMGPAGYVQMVEKYGRKPLLGRLEVNGMPSFQGVIIVRADSPLTSLSGLAGKRFAFGDPRSTMSHLVPRFMLLQEGLTIEDLGGSAFLDNHNNVALGVLSGDYDAGAVKEEVFYKYKKRGLKTLAKTPSISEHLFVAGSRLPPHVVQMLRDALYALGDTEKGLYIMKSLKHSITAIVPVNDKDYDNLRVIMKAVGAPGVYK